MQEMWVPSLGQEVPLEKEMAPHSGILAWKNPLERGAWQAIIHGVTKQLGDQTQVSHIAGGFFTS